MATDINITPTAGMPPVSTETTGAQTSSGVSGVQESPRAAEALKEDLEAKRSVAGAQEQVGEQIAPAEEAKAATLDAQSTQNAAGAAEAAQVRQNYLNRIQFAQQAVAKDQQAFQDFQFHNLWSSAARGQPGGKTTGDRIMAIVEGAFGGFSAGILGGPNYALQRLQQEVAQDFERQKLQLARKEKIAEWRAAGVKDLYSAMQTDLAALEVKQGLAFKAVADKAMAAQLRAGIPIEQAKNNVTVQGLLEAEKAANLSAAQRHEQNYDRKQEASKTEQVTTAKGSAGGVEADKNAANFAVLKNHGEWIAGTMPKLSQEDIKAIRAVLDTEDFYQGDGTVRAAIAAGAAKLGLDPETGVSSVAKEYIDRVRRAAEGLGRVQSGAAIGSIENKRFVNSLMPKASDSPEDLQGRARRVIEDIDSRGAYLSRPPRAGTTGPVPGAPTQPTPFKPDDKAAIRDDIRKTTAWIKANPKDEKVGAARAALAKMHTQLGASP